MRTVALSKKLTQQLNGRVLDDSRPLVDLEETVEESPALLKKAPLLHACLTAGGMGVEDEVIAQKVAWLLERGADPDLVPNYASCGVIAHLSWAKFIPLEQRLELARRMLALGADPSEIPPGEVADALGTSPGQPILSYLVKNALRFFSPDRSEEQEQKAFEGLDGLLPKLEDPNLFLPPSFPLAQPPVFRLVHYAALSHPAALERVLALDADVNAPAAAGTYAVHEGVKPSGGVCPEVAIVEGDTALDVVGRVMELIRIKIDEFGAAPGGDPRLAERTGRLSRLDAARALLVERGGREVNGSALAAGPPPPFKVELDEELRPLGRYSELGEERLGELLARQLPDANSGPYRYLNQSLQLLRRHVRVEEVAAKVGEPLFGMMLRGPEACYTDLERDELRASEVAYYPKEVKKARRNGIAVVARHDAALWFMERTKKGTRVCYAHPEEFREIAPTVEEFVRRAVAPL